MAKQTPLKVDKPSAQRIVGESVLDKLVRLLASYNREMIVEGAGSEIQLVLSLDGAMQLRLVTHVDPPKTIVGFRSSAEAFGFFEGTQLERVEFLSTWARQNAE